MSIEAGFPFATEPLSSGTKSVAYPSLSVPLYVSIFSKDEI